MKKTLSLVLVAAMLLSMVALVPFASSAAHTLDENNVGVEAYRFDGNVVYSELNGRGVGNSKYGWLDAITVKEGKNTSATLNIDGIIEEGEWGQASFSVHSDYAASNDGLIDRLNTAYEVPSAENTFFYYDASNYRMKAYISRHRSQSKQISLMTCGMVKYQMVNLQVKQIWH